MSLIVEDGSGKADAQSYLSTADADTYLASHASSAAWAAKTTPEKEALLVRATRALDALVAFTGYKLSATQALQWPRQAVPYKGPVPSVEGQAAVSLTAYPSNVIPPELKNATAELAAYCIDSNPGAPWDGAGLKSVNLGDGALEIAFDPTSQPAALPPMIGALLRDFTLGTGGGKGMVRIRRA